MSIAEATDIKMKFINVLICLCEVVYSIKVCNDR
jgi:hypothetical protein